MRDFAYRIGTIPFSAYCASADGVVTLGISVESSSGQWTEALGAEKAIVEPEVVLANLISRWDRIAGPYADHSPDRFSFNMSELAASGATGPVVFVRDGVNVSFVFEDHTVEMASDSVIPVEVLLGLGDLLASFAPTHLSAMWHRISDATKLPAFPKQDSEMNQSIADTRLETEWYARALGQSVAYYELVANWLHARQLAFAVGAPGHAEPTVEDYDVRTLHKDVPSMYAIDSLYGLSKEKLGYQIDELRRLAVSQRNYAARHHVVFRRFFPRD